MENIKLVIWDLDDTLWRGSLAENGAVELFEERAALLRELNRRGIVSAICSKNDPQRAMQALQKAGLWDQFVFPRIAFAPKGPAIKQLIDDMQLRAANVLFADDNIHNLHEAKTLLPDLHIVDASLPDFDALLHKIVDANKPVQKNRLDEYRMLQARTEDRASAVVSNEEFLRSCDLHIAMPYQMDNLDYSERIEELINRANQLNYTQSRIEREPLTNMIIDVVHCDTWSVFVWDKYGYHGLAGFAAVHKPSLTVTHFTFSCRVMHMGIESAVLAAVQRNFAPLDLSRLANPPRAETPGWITIEPFNAPGIREKITAHEKPGLREKIALRLMFDCQSGGIAHYSRRRPVIDFDNNPRLFGMRMVLEDRFTQQKYPAMLAYGAGIDYFAPRWPEGFKNLEDGVYQSCVEKFCDHLERIGSKMLVILPPENAPDDKYRPHGQYTRERAILLNNLWREQAKKRSFLFTFDLSAIAQPDDMPDVSHFYSGLLQKIAAVIDAWYENPSADTSLLTLI